MEAQTSFAQVMRSIEGIREFGYQGKHRESLAHSRNKLPGLEVMKKRIQSRGWLVKSQRRQT